MTLLWTVVERFVAGVGASSSPAGLMEFAFGRVSETWDVPASSIAARNTTTQHLFQVRINILGGKKKQKKTNKNLDDNFAQYQRPRSTGTQIKDEGFGP